MSNLVRLVSQRLGNPRARRLRPSWPRATALAGAFFAPILLLLGSEPLSAQRNEDNTALASRPGPVEIEPPTLHALAFRWPVAGDANGNARVSLAYRASGETIWREGLPLFRVGRESRQPARRPRPGVVFAGSLPGLESDTSYEVSLRLEDPDGGDRERDFVLRTRPVPVPPTDPETVFVAPVTSDRLGPGDGSATKPFIGLKVALERVRPGTTIRLHAGRYPVSSKVRPPSGLPGRPTVIKPVGDGPVELDGQGAEVLVDLSDLRHVWLIGLDLVGAGILVLADRAHELVVQGNSFTVSRAGLVAKGAVGEESLGLHIVDNAFSGTTHWPRSKGIEHIFGLGITGAGHTVAHNHFEDLGDCIRGAWVDSGEGLLSASDIFANEFQTCTDDGIEIDHADANVRVFRNRITNSFAAVSMQPVFGGPVYVYRNLIFNTLYSPFKLHNHTSGVLLFHNTSLRLGIPFPIFTRTETVRDCVSRNNLYVGSEGPAITSSATMIGCDFASDGYALPQGDFALWNGVTYKDVSAARQAAARLSVPTGVMFAPQGLFDGEVSAPRNRERRFTSRSVQAHLSAGSEAIDQGVRLPSFNDGFAGAAPDLGCCEFGADPWGYGPRPPWRK